MGKKNKKIDENVKKINALIRNSEYIKDYKEFEALIQKQKMTQDYDSWDMRREKWYEITRKYGILRPISYKKSHLKFELEDLQKSDWLEDFFIDEETAVDLLTNTIFEDKYLLIKINLSKNMEKIRNDFQEIVTDYKKRVKKVIKTTARNKDYTFPPFKIYDMRHKENLSLIKIAKIISGINENPAYNEKVKKTYKAIDRAYKRDCNMIEQVNKQPVKK